MAGFVYCMVCLDMPHLFKIGRTVCAYQRLREANSHDTFKPPAGYTFLHVVRVPDMAATEAALHAQFAARRRKNSQGNSSEFFEIDSESVRLAFAAVEGELLDVSNLSQAAESAENAKTRLLLRAAVAAQQPCAYRQINPKHPGTKCHARYERYKVAQTVDEALQLGTFEDLVYDYAAGFFTFEDVYDLSALFSI